MGGFHSHKHERDHAHGEKHEHENDRDHTHRAERASDPSDLDLHHKGRRRSHRALFIALILNAAFLLVEATVGWMTGSLALLSDATHMFGDVAALLLAVVAAQLTRQPATAGRTFGLLRAEILGAFINAGALVVACVFILKEAVARLLAGPPPVPGLWVMVVAALGLLINIASAWALYRSRWVHDLNIRAALVHMMADALGSVGALVAGALVFAFQIVHADAIVSLLIAAIVLYTAWGLLRDSGRILLEFAPVGLEQNVVEDTLHNIRGVREVHDLHVWSVGSGDVTVTAHLVIEESTTPFDVLADAESALRDGLGIRHSTLQVDPAAGLPCRQRECPALPRDRQNH